MSCSSQVILKVKKSKLVIVSFKVVNICLKLHTQERINFFFHNVVPKCWEVNKQSPTIVRSKIDAVEVCSWPPTPKGQTSYSSQVGRSSYPRAWVHAFHPPGVLSEVRFCPGCCFRCTLKHTHGSGPLSLAGATAPSTPADRTAVSSFCGCSFKGQFHVLDVDWPALSTSLNARLSLSNGLLLLFLDSCFLLDCTSHSQYSLHPAQYLSWARTLVFLILKTFFIWGGGRQSFHLSPICAQSPPE